jgi:hypothetical protein
MTRSSLVSLRDVIRHLLRRTPARRWVVRLYDAPSGRADYLFVAARSEHEATRNVNDFIEYVDRGRSQPELLAQLQPGPPKWGDLGATPPGQAAQRIAEVRRWHVGGEDFGDREPDLGRWPHADDLALIAEWRRQRRFEP